MENSENGSPAVDLTGRSINRRDLLIKGGGALAAIGIGVWAAPAMSKVPVARAWTNATPCPPGQGGSSDSSGDGSSTTDAQGSHATGSGESGSESSAHDPNCEEPSSKSEPSDLSERSSPSTKSEPTEPSEPSTKSEPTGSTGSSDK